MNVWGHLLEIRAKKAATYASPGELAKVIAPTTVNTPALDLIDQELIRLMDTPDSRLIISMAPQEGKSMRVSRDLPLWALLNNPDLRIVNGSYGQGLANRNGRLVRNAIATHPELGLKIAADHGAAAEWSIEGRQGGLIAVGRGAGITGRPADLLIIDDPIKDRTEADSKTVRDTCWDWWTDSLASRLSPGARVVLIATRWHEDDLTGRLMARDAEAGWHLLNIPAQADHNPDKGETDILGRQPGEYMISAQGRTSAQWEQRKATAGSRTWAALYQGRPTPQAGDIFQRDYWRHWHHPPTDLNHVIQSWDMTFKDTKHADFVVGQVWARIGADAYLLDQVRGRWSFTETCRQVEALTQRWPMALGKLVEDKANGTAVIDLLRQRVPGLIPVEPRGGKVVRANAVSPLIEAGNVYLPPRHLAPWVDAFIDEAAGFPNASHDDQVDAMTQALAHLGITPAAGHAYGTTFYDIG